MFGALPGGSNGGIPTETGCLVFMLIVSVAASGTLLAILLKATEFVE